MIKFFELPEKEENRTKGVMFGNLIFSIILIIFSCAGFYSLIKVANWIALIISIIICILVFIMGIHAFTNFYVLYKYLKNKKEAQ